MTTDTLEFLAERAVRGDGASLEDLVLQIQDRIYGIALRMLYHPSDAEDAAQEILIKIVTHLGSFEGKSAFTTWMFRIAANHLLDIRRKAAGIAGGSLDECDRMIEALAAKDWSESTSESYQGLVVEEIRISCIQGLFQCLNRERRVAFILSQVFDVSGEDGAEILGISGAAFRKRLSRAKEALYGFMTRSCSLVNPANPCSCRNVAAALKIRADDRLKSLEFATHPCRIRHSPRTENRLREMDELQRVGVLFKQDPDFIAPDGCIDSIRRLVASGCYEFLC